MSREQKCFKLMSVAEFQKMREGKDYNSVSATYAKDKRGAEVSFKCGMHTGEWVMVWGDGPKEYKVVSL